MREREREQTHPGCLLSSLCHIWLCQCGPPFPAVDEGRAADWLPAVVLPRICRLPPQPWINVKAIRWRAIPLSSVWFHWHPLSWIHGPPLSSFSWWRRDWRLATFLFAWTSGLKSPAITSNSLLSTGCFFRETVAAVNKELSAPDAKCSIWHQN